MLKFFLVIVPKLFKLFANPWVRLALIASVIFLLIKFPKAIVFILFIMFLPFLILGVLAIIVRHKVKKTQSEFRDKMDDMMQQNIPPDDDGFKDVEIRVVDDKK